MPNELTEIITRIQAKTQELKQDFQVRIALLDATKNDFAEALEIAKNGGSDEAMTARLRCLQAKIGDAVLVPTREESQAPEQTIEDCLIQASQKLANAFFACPGHPKLNFYLKSKGVIRLIADELAQGWSSPERAALLIERAEELTGKIGGAR